MMSYRCVACGAVLASDEAFVVSLIGPQAYAPARLACRACLFGDWGAALVRQALDDSAAVGALDDDATLLSDAVGIRYLRLDEREGGADTCYPEDLCVLYRTALARAVRPPAN